MKIDDNIKDLKLYITGFISIIIYALVSTTSGLISNIIKNNSLTFNIIYQIISIIIGIIFGISLFKEKDEEFIKRVKNIFRGFLSIATYFILTSFITLPFKIAGIDYTAIPKLAKIIYSVCYELLIVSIIIFINFDKIKSDIKDLKLNHKKYYSSCLKYWLIALVIMQFSNLFIILFTNNGIANNEEIIREQFQISPVYIFITGVILAPILEEMVFRRSFKNIIKNKYAFIIVSGLVFGSLHVFNGGDYSLSNLLFLIPYCTPGFFFAYMLEKYDNVLVPMGFHLLHNGIMISLQFILYLFQ